MAKHTLREWYLATRPWSFTVSAMPVVVTTAFLWWYSQQCGTLSVNWWAALLALGHSFLFTGGVVSAWDQVRQVGRGNGDS